jgi:predicted component of type VI protein secretion system
MWFTTDGMGFLNIKMEEVFIQLNELTDNNVADILENKEIFSWNILWWSVSKFVVKSSTRTSLRMELLQVQKLTIL